jgi:26S proteasome regulatory subunit N9
MSSYADPTRGAVDHCQTMAEQFPDLAEQYYQKIAHYCQDKLWHQLTMLLLEFVDDDSKAQTLRPLSDSKNTFLALYQKVVSAVDKKINQLSLSRMAAAVAFSSLQAGSTVEESKALLEDLLSKQEAKPNSTATVLYLQSKLGLLTLNTLGINATKEQLDQIYTTIKTNGSLLVQLIPDTPEAIVVNAAHYEMSMTYYKIVGPPESFYEEAIHYLNYYQPKEDGSSDAKSHALAVDLCLAALTGEGVYNLGQVVSNPILKVLHNTPDAWLVELLQACASGSVQQFKALTQQKYPSQIASQPALVNMSQQMLEKITLLGLVELVFSKPASERTLPFTDIAQGLEIPLEQVEWVIMRAFSVELMKGIMDQVAGEVHVTWILPRALGKEQMADLAARFGEWASKVSKIKAYMQEESPTLTQ